MEQEREIRDLAAVFSYSALRRWFYALPAKAHRSAHSAHIPDTAYDVRMLDSWTYDRLTATFTQQDSPEPTVNIRARTVGQQDDDFLAHSPLVWSRRASNILSLNARGVQYGRTGGGVDRYLARVENSGDLTVSQAELSVLAIGTMLTEQIAAQSTKY